ncbi:MAG: DsbC family protein [Desulfuromonadales bacterium]
MRITIYLLVSLFLFVSSASAFKQMNAEEADCGSCHTLTKDEAKEIFTGLQGEVLSVEQTEIPGFWEIGMKTQNQNIPLYLDYSKAYLFSGNIIRMKDKKNLTEESYRKLNPVDLSRIPTDDALLLGNPKAANKIIVFTDPLCPYCVKLHEVMKAAVEKRSDLLFQIKLMPLNPSSNKIAETIVCNKSLEQLEFAFAGQEVPEASCESKAIEQTLAVAKSLGITSTPTLILPNGQLAPGYKPLDALLKIIDQAIASK